MFTISITNLVTVHNLVIVQSAPDTASISYLSVKLNIKFLYAFYEANKKCKYEKTLTGSDTRNPWNSC